MLPKSISAKNLNLYLGEKGSAMELLLKVGGSRLHPMVYWEQGRIWSFLVWFFLCGSLAPEPMMHFDNFSVVTRQQNCKI